MRALVLVLVFFLAGLAQASPVAMQVGAGVARSAASSTSYITTASATSWAGAAYNSGMTTQVGGRLVTVPATWRMASNAGQIAVAALRTTPGGLAAGVALSWLLGYGIKKCADGTWCTQPSTVPEGDVDPNSLGWVGIGPCATAMANCTALQAANTILPTSGGWSVCRIQLEGTRTGRTYITNASTPCASGRFDTIGHPNGDYVPPQGEPVPATGADWAKVQPSTIPDVVLNNLARDGVFLDVSPTIDTAPQTVPLSDPYVDPVTGKGYQDVAKVTPNADGKTADVQVAKQEVDGQGKPVTDASGVQVAPVEQKDQCVGHEDRLGCMKLDDPPQGPNLQDSQKTISITPDTGWGADSMACPADLTTVTRTGGVALAFSFKPVCDGADMFRPVIIGMAWVAAVLIALGVGRKGD